MVGGKSLSRLTRLEAISISADNYFSMESPDGGWLTGLGRLTGLTSAKFYGFVDVRPRAAFAACDCKPCQMHVVKESEGRWPISDALAAELATTVLMTVDLLQA